MVAICRFNVTFYFHFEILRRNREILEASRRVCSRVFGLMRRSPTAAPFRWRWKQSWFWRNWEKTKRSSWIEKGKVRRNSDVFWCRRPPGIRSRQRCRSLHSTYGVRLCDRTAMFGKKPDKWRGSKLATICYTQLKIEWYVGFVLYVHNLFVAELRTFS